MGFTASDVRLHHLRIFGYVLQVIKYCISVPLDRGGFDGWNLMPTSFTAVESKTRGVWEGGRGREERGGAGKGNVDYFASS